MQAVATRADSLQPPPGPGWPRTVENFTGNLAHLPAVTPPIRMPLSVSTSSLHNRLAALAFAALALGFAPGCGSEIGDSCSIASDCASDGTRTCDTAQSGGYCTIFGCDFDTCPDEGVCIRFFAIGSTGLPCDPTTEDISTDDCLPEELCSLKGDCVPRAAEIRYCMRACEGSGDCRDGYECRGEALMREHGGEPVPAPGESVVDSITPFCAEQPLVQ